MVDAMQTAQSSESFCFTTGLRGFHVYSTTKGWKPYLQEKITLKREHDNVHDRFAVSGLTTLRGRLAPVVVGHIPRELSRYVWYAQEKGAKFTGEVLTAKAKRSPLIQGGLEIPIKVNVQWTDSRNLAVLKQRYREQRRSHIPSRQISQMIQNLFWQKFKMKQTLRLRTVLLTAKTKRAQLNFSKQFTTIQI